MKQLQFKVIEEREEAKRMWELFSPHKTIDDEWDFRHTWMRHLGLPLHFIVGYDWEQPVGLLALQLNTVKGLNAQYLNMTEPYLEFFGSIDTDDNRIYFAPGYENYTQDFLAQINQPAILTSLQEKIVFNHTESAWQIDKFTLDLSYVVDFQGFLQKCFDGTSRHRLINRINKFHKSYTVEIKDGTIEDLELLFQFSMKRFGERSAFHYEDRKKVFYDFYKAYNVDMFTVVLDGVKKAVSFGIQHKETYTSLNMGYDYAIRDLGKLVGVTQIQRALNRGYKTYDAGQGNNGWKEQLHLTKIPQYKLVLNSR